jgi:hypothetical protein
VDYFARHRKRYSLPEECQPTVEIPYGKVLNVDGIYVARTKKQAEYLLTQRIASVKRSIRDRAIELEDLTTKDTVYLVLLPAAHGKLSWCVTSLLCL